MPGFGRHDRKLEHVLKAAAEVFSEKGFDHASIRAVAERAGISVPGLYHYVRSKDELLYFIQFNAFDSLLAAYRHDAEGMAEPEARLGLLIGNHLARFVPNLAELVVCSREINRLEGDFRKRVGARQRAYFETAVDIFADLESKHGGASVSPRTSALAMFGAINWIYTWYHPRTGPSAESLAADFTHLFIQGALPRDANLPRRLPAAPSTRLAEVGGPARRR